MAGGYGDTRHAYSDSNTAQLSSVFTPFATPVHSTSWCSGLENAENDGVAILPLGLA